MERAADGSCVRCRGRMVVTTGTVRRRCDCYWEMLGARVSLLRHGELLPPEGWATTEVWPLRDRTVIGDEAVYTTFRRQAWRSLLYYLDRDLGFDVRVMEAGRLTEIVFNRDEEIKSYRDLHKPALLVLVCGKADMAPQFTKHATHVVLALRAMYGQPSWVYAGRPNQLQDSPVRDEGVSAPSPARRSRREDEPPRDYTRRSKRTDG
jgi:hypothetical protein